MLRVPLLLVNFLMVPVDSTQSFVDDLSPLSHSSPLGITVLIHFNYTPPVVVFQLFRLMFLLALLFLVTLAI